MQKINSRVVPLYSKAREPRTVYYLEGTNAPWSLSFDAIFSLFCAPSVIFSLYWKRSLLGPRFQWTRRTTLSLETKRRSENWRSSRLLKPFVIWSCNFLNARVCWCLLLDILVNLALVYFHQKLHNKALLTLFSPLMCNWRQWLFVVWKMSKMWKKNLTKWNFFLCRNWTIIHLLKTSKASSNI